MKTRTTLSLGIGLLWMTHSSAMTPPDAVELLEEADRTTAEPGVSPVRRIERGPAPPRADRPPPIGERSIDGTGNNPIDSTINGTYTQLMRYMGADYADGVWRMAGLNRPGPREISNTVNAQSESFPNSRNASDYLWQWGQFLDHDIDLTDGTDPPEDALIEIPAGDPWFDPTGTGVETMSFNRSAYDPDTGDTNGSPRQQLNEITGWIDASNVYGSDDERATALRTNDGSGRLLTSDGDLLPFNHEGLANAGGSSDTLFLAGDVRANEQVGLTAMHTLFVREHNRLADEIASRNPEWEGDRIYEAARRMVGAQMQVITYREFLPLLLGPEALTPYQGYDSGLDASIMNSFSSAAYRLGHSLLSGTLLRLDANGETIEDGDLQLRDAFFAPQEIVDHGIEPLLRGLAAQVCQDLDVYVVDDVRNFLFGAPGSGGFDLASLNIQRGRDHGLPGYNAARVDMGLPAVADFSEITSDRQIQSRLAEVYDSVDDIDLWVGGLAEDDVQGAMVGPLFFEILRLQFEVLRDGDRFWYQRALSPREIAAVEDTRLVDIIRRNTEITNEMGNDVFRIPGAPPRPAPGPGRNQRPPR